MNVPELALMLLRDPAAPAASRPAALNFDAKIRRQSIDPDDLLHAHVGSMDACARALLAAADMIEDGALTAPLAERYAGWAGPEGRAILGGAALARRSRRPRAQPGFDPQPRSGRQEYLESLVNRYV